MVPCGIFETRISAIVLYKKKWAPYTIAALPYTEYPLRMLKFEIRAEITEYDANGRGGVCTKRCLCECVKNACGSLQMS